MLLCGLEEKSHRTYIDFKGSRTLSALTTKVFTLLTTNVSQGHNKGEKKGDNARMSILAKKGLKWKIGEGEWEGFYNSFTFMPQKPRYNITRLIKLPTGHTHNLNQSLTDYICVFKPRNV